ncbi:DUF2239 family protein [Paenibacillus daejeonensis]|uniref:DUF2239 family protein n=1 Tax=Paenibacillus daejeonensis TaxID=135193 RepID=UPI00036FBA3B|nr:DUF2239 family protein [Paenibacillus daejeonensis]
MKNDDTSLNYTAFLGVEMVATGSLQHVISNAKATLEEREWVQLLIFDDATGKQIDVDFRNDGVLGQLENTDDSPRRVGRPKLGVVSGEVTLLPRHWEWLKGQPGGASVTLRKLIDEARRVGGQNKVRASQEVIYHFMTAMAGNFPQYEEALRFLYAGDSDRFYNSIAEWAPDIRNHIRKLAVDAFTGERQ